MSLLNNGGWSDSMKQVLGKSTIPCRISEIRETPGKADNGKWIPDMTYVTLITEASAKTNDGEDKPPGFLTDIAFGTTPADAPKPEPGSGDAQRDEISKRSFRELVVAALNLPRNTKDAEAQLTQAGGADALKGKRVLVDFSVSKGGYQNAKFSPAPAS